MIDTRLALALDGGGLVLPASGRIAVMGPPGDATLGYLPSERVAIIEGFKPLYDQWKNRGFDCQVELDVSCAVVVVCLPRAKAQARAMIAQAMTLTDGPIVIDGQKTDGVDSILKEMRKRTTVGAPISKAHGKLFYCIKTEPLAFEDWREGPAQTSGGFWTAPGVFSADSVDPASELLVRALPDKLGRQVGDFGAGWGYLSAHVLTREEVETVHLVEAQHMALECARRNVTDARAAFHWADATRWHPSNELDTVVMNPPFHTSRAADPSLGQGFVKAAAAALGPRGQLFMVSNRHLPYEQTLQAAFTNVFELGGDARFKLFHAVRPKRIKRN